MNGVPQPVHVKGTTTGEHALHDGGTTMFIMFWRLFLPNCQ